MKLQRVTPQIEKQILSELISEIANDKKSKNSHLIILSVNIWNTTDTIGQIT